MGAFIFVKIKQELTQVALNVSQCECSYQLKHTEENHKSE